MPPFTMYRMCKRVAFNANTFNALSIVGATVRSCSTDFLASRTRSANALLSLSTWLTNHTQASSEGTHFLVPWLQKAILFDVRTKPKIRVTVRHRTFAHMRNCIAHRNNHRY